LSQTQQDPRLKKEVIMKKISAIILALIIALSSAFANTGFKPVRGLGFEPASGHATVISDQYFRTTSSIPSAMSTSLKVPIGSFALGAIGVDLPSGHLNIVSVKGPKQISVSLTAASGGAANDNLTFRIGAKAGTPKGLHTLEVALENKLTGDNGTITLILEVR
jgi:hypothetical protein